MSFKQKILNIFFTESDQGIRFPDEYNAERFRQSNIIAEGARSQTLMSNPIFQESVAEMYLALESQLDSIEDTMPDADDHIRWVRVQRRALRQVCAMLDNKIAQKEMVEQALRQEAEQAE
jgi:uncharacterized protein YjaG (DUF416 family)